MFVGGDASLAGRLFVASDLSVNGRFLLAGDASLAGRLFVASDLSVNGRLFSGGDASLGGRVFVGSDLSVNGRLFAGGDASLGGRLFVASDLSVNGRLFAGGDVSLGGRLYVPRTAAIGLGAGLPIGSANAVNTYTLDISSGNTNFSTGNNPYPGAVRIWEASGTMPTASGGTLVLQHGDVSGVSSIVFPSTTNFGNDYASIAYYESISGGILATTTGKQFNYNYYNDASSTSSSALVFNVQSNPYSYDTGVDVSFMDNLILQPTGSCIIDACANTVGQTIIQPRGGNVGINKIYPTQALDVSGQIGLSGKIVSLGVYPIAQNLQASAVTYSAPTASATASTGITSFFSTNSIYNTTIMYGSNAVVSYLTASTPTYSTYYSTNSGATWTASTGLFNASVKFAMYGNNVVAVPTSGAFVPYYSSDGGKNWQSSTGFSSNAPVAATPSNTIVMSGSNAVVTYAISTAATNTYYSTDSGITWKLSNLPTFVSATPTAIPWRLAMDGNNVVAVSTITGTSSGVVPYYSNDGGKTWTASTGVTAAGGSNALAGSNNVGIYGSNAILLYGQGVVNTHYSNNYGATWIAASTGLNSSYTWKFAMYGNYAVAVSTNTTTAILPYYSSDGGRNWQVSSGFTANANATTSANNAIYMYGRNAIVSYATSSTPINTYYSTDFGVTWSSSSLIANTQSNWVFNMYGNSAVAVFTSTSQGQLPYYVTFTGPTSSWTITPSSSYTISNQTMLLAIKVSGSKSSPGNVTYSLAYNNSNNIILTATAYHNRVNYSMPTTSFYIWNSAPVGTVITSWYVATTGSTTTNDFLDVVLVALPI